MKFVIASRPFQKSRSYLLALCIPFIIVGILHLNNQFFYDLDFGYDFQQHHNNVYHIIHSGQMPQPPLNRYIYEAFQAPLFYIVSSWFLKLSGDDITDKLFQSQIPTMLFFVGMIWVVLVSDFVLRYFRQITLPMRVLMICVVVLFPCNTIMSVMFNNDMPVTILGAVAIWTLWLMCRSNQLTSRRLWLRVAALTGLATLFKLSGVIIIATYVMLAVYIVLTMLQKHQCARAREVIVAASIGLPLMIAPWIINTIHTRRYVDNSFGVTFVTDPLWEVVPPEFFLTFDFNIFHMPFAFENGSGSYWTLQFLTLHNDYYNHWNSDAYKTYPADSLVNMPHRDPIPHSRLLDAIILIYLAFPITGLMIFGFTISLRHVLFRPRLALRDGSIVIVLYTIMAQSAQLIRFVSHPDVRGVIIHARHLGFMYGFLLLIGVWQLIKFTKHHKHSKRIRLLLATTMIGYCFIAIRLMWLPPI